MLRTRRQLSPPQLLALSILVLILLGSLVLWLPVSASPGRSLTFVDAFFTAASAVCVTGLIVVDTPTVLSLFGQAVLLILIQLGGLGYMTVSTVLATALGRSVTLQERLTLQEALNVYDLEGLVRFAGTVLKLTLVFELSGAVILTGRWWGELGPWQAAWHGLFHAVSAFNNAGFALWSDSLIPWQTDPTVNLVMSALIVAGGLGFFVINELLRVRRHVNMSLHTRLVLASSAVLLIGGTLAILVLEWDNPGTLGPLAGGDRVLAAWFQAVSARTAGFNTVNVGAYTPATLFLIMALMFIGASPGGTGGGVKTTTFSVTVAALWSTVRGDLEPRLFGRRISAETVARAFFVSLIAFLALNTFAGLLLVTEARPLMDTLFEATSAFGTVGLSTGVPGSPLSLVGVFGTIGKLLVVLLMFTGRIGPLTLAFALARRGSSRPKIRYPEGKVLLG